MTGGLVPCPRCGAEQLTEPEDAGRTVVCWECGEHFPAPGLVPTVRPGPSAAAAATPAGPGRPR